MLLGYTKDGNIYFNILKRLEIVTCKNRSEGDNRKKII